MNMNNYVTEFASTIINKTNIRAYGHASEPLVCAKMMSILLGLYDYNTCITRVPIGKKVEKYFTINNVLYNTVMLTTDGLRSFMGLTDNVTAINLISWMESLINGSTKDAKDAKDDKDPSLADATNNHPTPTKPMGTAIMTPVVPVVPANEFIVPTFGPTIAPAYADVLARLEIAESKLLETENLHMHAKHTIAINKKKQVYTKLKLAETKLKMLDAKNSMSDAVCKISDAKHKISDAKHKMSDAKRKMLDIEYKMSDESYDISDAKHKMLDAEYKMLDAKNSMSDATCKMSDATCKMSDAKHKMSDATRKMLDAKNNISDAKYKMLDSTTIISTNAMIISTNAMIISANAMIISDNAGIISDNAIIITANAMIITASAMIITANAMIISTTKAVDNNLTIAPVVPATQIKDSIPSLMPDCPKCIEIYTDYGIYSTCGTCDAVNANTTPTAKHPVWFTSSLCDCSSCMSIYHHDTK